MPYQLGGNPRLHCGQMAPYVVGLVIFIAVFVAAVLMWPGIPNKQTCSGELRWHPHIEFHKPPAGKKDMRKDEARYKLFAWTYLSVWSLTPLALVILSHFKPLDSRS